MPFIFKNSLNIPMQILIALLIFEQMFSKLINI